MKMLKKMAALLLAGVMALALLTACGDDSAPSYKKFQQDISTGKGSMTMALPLMKDGKMQNGIYEVMEITADNIGSLNQGTDTMQDLLDGMASAYGVSVKITKIGVAAKTVNGKTYAAVAMTYEVTAKPQQ